MAALDTMMDALLTVQEVADARGVSRARIEHEIMAGKLQTIKWKGRHFILRVDFEEYLSRRRSVGRPLGYSPTRAKAAEKEEIAV
jgi:hypothetical protein